MPMYLLGNYSEFSHALCAASEFFAKVHSKTSISSGIAFNRVIAWAAGANFNNINTASSFQELTPFECLLTPWSLITALSNHSY